MKRIAVILAIAVASLGLHAPDADEVRAELEALQGTWKAVAMEAGGAPLPKDAIPSFTFIIGADGKSVAKTVDGEEQATISVDPTQTPRTINNLHESGAQKGKTQYGIYTLEGDKWRVCMTFPGVPESSRPKNFNTKDTANVVFVFERQREAVKQ